MSGATTIAASTQRGQRESMRDVTFKIDLFEKIVNRSYEAIIIVNEQRHIVFWNDAAEKIFGYTAEMVIGRDMHSLITPSRYREAANAAHAHYRETGVGKVLGKRVEIEALNSLGQEFWVELGINDVQVDGRRWAFAIIRDVSERKKMERKLEQQAQTDALSGLHNRRAFQFYLESAIGHGSSVAFIDGDDFKRINDRLGHEAGDRVIVTIASCLKQVFNDAICVARVGGDEFAVLHSESNRERLLTRFNELRATVRDAVDRLLDHEDFSISIGAVLDPSGKAGSRELLALADQALYESKAQAADRITLKAFSPTGM